MLNYNNTAINPTWPIQPPIRAAMEEANNMTNREKVGANPYQARFRCPQQINKRVAALNKFLKNS